MKEIVIDSDQQKRFCQTIKGLTPSAKYEILFVWGGLAAFACPLQDSHIFNQGK